MDFEKDIFISYAHMDEESVDKDLEGWISIFHETLQSYVATKWGNKPVIWRDNSLQGNEIFSKEILSQFSRLKLFVSIITPRYLKSEWCQREVDTFFESAEKTGGISIDNKARIFKIVKTPVKPEKQPEKLREILEYPFYRKDPKTGRDRELKLEFGEEFKQLFYQTVDDVATDIAMLLDKLGSNTLNGKPSKGKIYLADTSYDLLDYREGIKRQLEDDGYTVYPNKVLPLVLADKFLAEVEHFMKDCSLSIHLVGNEDYGAIPGRTDDSILVLQNEVAGKLKLDRLIWIAPPPTVDQGSPPLPMVSKLEKFLKHLRTDEQLHNDSDLLEGTLEDFKQAIADTLKRQEAKKKALEKEKELARQKAELALKSPPELVVTGEPRLIYFVCDKRDLEEAKVVGDWLDKCGHQVSFPSFEGDEAAQKERHDEALESADAVVIYYGYGDEKWMESNVMTMHKVSKLLRIPYKAKLAYVAGPAAPGKESYLNKLLTVVNGTGGFAPSLLNDFLEKLK